MFKYQEAIWEYLWCLFGAPGVPESTLGAKVGPGLGKGCPKEPKNDERARFLGSVFETFLYFFVFCVCKAGVFSGTVSRRSFS